MNNTPWVNASDNWPEENVFVITYRGEEVGFSIERAWTFCGQHQWELDNLVGYHPVTKWMYIPQI